MKLSILMSTLISLVLALIVSSAVHAQTKEIAPFVGIWSNTQEGCKKLIDGELDKMDTVHSTYFGILEVSTVGIDYLYSSGGFARCSFRLEEIKKEGKRVIAPVFCESGGEDEKSPPHMIVFTPISPTAMHIDFEGAHGTKVRCRY